MIWLFWQKHKIITFFLGFITVFLIGMFNLPSIPLVLQLLLPLIIIAFFWKAINPKFQRNWKHLGIGVGLGLGITVFTTLASLLERSLFHATAANQTALTETVKNHPSIFIGMAFSIAVVSPIIEELVFRGGLVFRLKKYDVLISGLFFGFLHVGIPTTPSAVFDIFVYVACGLALAYSYKRSENILTNISAHIMNNLVTVILLAITIF